MYRYQLFAKVVFAQIVDNRPAPAGIINVAGHQLPLT